MIIINIKKTVALFILTMVGCKNNDAQKTAHKEMENKDTFSWSATITNPHGYTVEIHEGYIADDIEVLAPFVNLGSIDQGWNYDGDGLSSSNKIPTHFSLTWLGYADKKFWKATGKLPSDRILALFQQGYNHINSDNLPEHITYKHLAFGLAPGGMVVVWLSGLAQRVEIATYQAEETFVDNNSFWRNPENMNQKQFFDLHYSYIPPEIQAEIKAHGLPVGRWEKYRKLYNYRFQTQLYKPDVKERFDRQIKYWNGEEEILQKGMLDTYRKKPLPSFMASFYLDTKLEWGEAEFDDQEIMHAFETISQKHPGEPIDIIAKVGFEYRDLTFTVVCGKDSIPLKKVELTNMSGVAK
jgi:hypothetical protein